MSQAALAEHLGVSFQQVQKYERGANRISASMLVKTARALDCPGGFLLGARTVKEENHAPQEDALQAEFNSLLAIPGAVELLRAFAKVPQGEARSSVLAIVRSLANGAARV